MKVGEAKKRTLCDLFVSGQKQDESIILMPKVDLFVFLLGKFPVPAELQA